MESFIKAIIEFLKKLFGGNTTRNTTNNKNEHSDKDKTNTDENRSLDDKPIVNSNSKKLYALIVGIDEYQHVGKLGQAVSDANKVHKYLEKWCETQGVKYELAFLYDKNATREHILKYFKSHLGQATENDVALFYYSGHGSQEPIGEAFSDVEFDNNIETIVAVDSRGNGVPDIADKELRYLIHQVAEKNPHIVTIFDCCNSGGNTRDTEKVVRQQGSGESRDWNKFIFSEKYSTEADFLAAGGTNEALPEGEHIQISACQNIEFAYETSSRGGVFTNYLLSSLEQLGGGISYYALRNRIRYTINKRVYPQTPQIYVSGNELKKFEPFLQGNYKKVLRNTTVVYKTQNHRWSVDLGAIHGLPNDIPKDHYTVDILDAKGNKIADASIEKVKFGHSLLWIENGEDLLDEKQVYSGKIANVLVTTTNFHIAVDDKNIEQDIVNHFKTKEVEGVKWVDDESQAQYVIRNVNKHIIFTYPNDNRRLVQSIEYDVTEAESQKNVVLNTLIEVCNRIVKWEFVHQIAPPSSSQKNPIDFRIFHNEGMARVVDNVAELEYEEKEIDGEMQWTGSINLKLINSEHKDLYFAIILMSQQFGVITHALGEQMVLIGGKESQEIPLDFVFSNYIKKDKWEYSTTWLKVLAAPEEADISLLAQEELEEPYSTRGSKGLTLSAKSRTARERDQWYVDMIEVRLKNPYL